MTGTFSSINTALTALRYSSASLDVASNNIANATTEGYTRRRVLGEAIGAPSMPAQWSIYDGVGGGVKTNGVERMTDVMLDARSRTENGNQSYLDVRATALQRIESGIGEPGDTGVSAAMSDFRSAWHDLANDPSSDPARANVLATATALTDAIHAQASSLASEATTQRGELLSSVNEVNAAAAQLAETNKAIAAQQLGGSDVTTLLDKRDQLALSLAKLTGGTASVRADGGMDVSVGGVSLVTGQVANTLTITGGTNPDGSADGNPVSLAITSSSGTTAVTGVTGKIGGVTDLLNTTIPGYLDGLNQVAVSLMDNINTLHQSGFDANGTAGGAFFTATAGSEATTISLAITDRSAIAASGVAGSLDGSIADSLGTAGAPETAYQQLVTGFGIQVNSAKSQLTTQQLLTTQVDSARDQLSGVNLDEEMVSMLQAQRGYEAAARVMTTLDSMLDTLINGTGVTR